jgi:predicted RNA-binding protein
MLLPFLRFLGDNKEHSLTETVDQICKEFNISNEERQRRSETGKLLVQGRVTWARTYLGKAKLLEGTKRGHFKITKRGLEVLSEKPTEINFSSLKKFPEFAAFLLPASKETQKEITVDTSLPKIEVAAREFPKHNDLRDLILEIGRFEGKIVEGEYKIDNWRLDAVWKTIASGNPKWAFEVHLKGNFLEALAKLKHAWDKWNSKPFLVTTDSDAALARILIEGSFHEMIEDARIITWQKIVELHKCLKEADQIKSEIRLVT